MSHIASALTRPSTLGIIAVAGSGAFYLGLKSKTITARQAHNDSEGKQNRVGEAANKEINYGVKSGREGGGV